MRQRGWSDCARWFGLSGALGWVSGCGGLAVDEPQQVGQSLQSLSVESAPATSTDDAEEPIGGGTPLLQSDDLELGNADVVGDQVVGIRFANIEVPQGATVQSASIVFTVDEVSTTPTSLQIRGEAVDNAQPFEARANHITSRPTTLATVHWQPSPWPVANVQHRSVDLSAIVQEVVDRPGWQSGGALAMLISGQGRRTAESFDGNRPDAAPRLFVEFSSPPECSAGQARCVGAELQGCNASGQFSLLAVCPSATTCDADRQQCNPTTQCPPNLLRCTGSVLELCRQAGDGFELMAVFVTPESCQLALEIDGVTPEPDPSSCAPGEDCPSDPCTAGECCEQQSTCPAENTVQCGGDICSSGSLCCAGFNLLSGENSTACGSSAGCSSVLPGVGPTVEVSCDEHSDCEGVDEVCCMVINNVNAGQVSCRTNCTADAVAAETGAPAAMFAVGALCRSEVGPLTRLCRAGQTCSDAVSTLPPEFGFCR